MECMERLQRERVEYQCECKRTGDGHRESDGEREVENDREGNGEGERGQGHTAERLTVDRYR